MFNRSEPAHGAVRYGTRAILTLDHRRHFSVVRLLDGGRFDLLPRGLA
jgi:hypothetical protein